MSQTKLKRLKALRELSGLSQWDIAKFLERDRSAVSNIENGHLILNPEEEKKLIEFLQQTARKRYADLAPLLESAVAG